MLDYHKKVFCIYICTVPISALCIVHVLTYSYNFFHLGTCIFMLDTTSITASKQIHFILDYITPKYLNSVLYSFVHAGILMFN